MYVILVFIIFRKLQRGHHFIRILDSVPIELKDGFIEGGCVI